MAEGLRVRNKRKPSYYEDEGFDDEDLELEGGGDFEQYDDDSPAEYTNKTTGICSVCKTGGKVLSCDSCSAVYHLECLDPPLRNFPKTNWSCTKCAEPLADIEKFLDCRVPACNDENEGGAAATSVKEYLVKWKSRSYIHCSWIPLSDIERAAKFLPGLRMKLNHFNKQFDSVKSFLDEDQPPIRAEWLIVDRVLNRRKVGDRDEYFVKWKELGYEEATWEDEDFVSSFQPELDRYEALRARGPRKAYYRRKGLGIDSVRKKNFVQFDSTPPFLSGGVLHPYQLEGLNFLRFARSQEKHVILADEMGLGKTIQSIAFLASLAEEGVSDPHLVVAPLSTLRNWEREFATWAPHMNTVVYVGSSQARVVLREHEFFYPKKKDKGKRKHYDNKKCKQDRIKFDVLLTSYEMINFDTSILKPIRWDCLIVDEGHRLKSKDSKLFQTLQNYSTFHRVLLTGTPLQNNLDELFTLMHFLDDSKFSSLEEFQQEFRDINQEEQVGRLHKMLSAHLLRRVKKDVLKQLPPKKELMLRVELSPIQKEYYKAILTRNYEVLSRHGGPQISLNNVVMELRKVCGHPYLLEGVEPTNVDEETLDRQRIEASGKLALLDKMMVKLKANGHRVLIYSQFQRVLDILEDWLSVKQWSYERIDGSVSGVERQIRIDRFNSPTSTRFCFLLSTRAGGLGINLATADTVVIYDSDWNPHADLQAMARAHRLGQKNTVMIFRLITRGSIEERMMQMTKKKMVLEHLVVGRMKTQVLNQEELNDILTYGAKELFTDDNDDRQIHYDDAAIDRLLDRSQMGVEETPVNEEDNDLLKAFKVANFEYVNDANDVTEKEAEAAEMNSSEFWENLLKERYESQHQQSLAVQEMGKGKRSRKQVFRENVDDDLAGMDYVSSEDEDHDELEDYNPPYDTSAKRPKKKPKVESESYDGPSPLMEGEGKSLKVLGFKRKHRALFVQILMRFGLGDFSWSAFVPHFEHKAIEEITEYATLFMTHITEDNTDSAFFSDGVPKEGLRIHDVFVRLAVLHLIGIKLKQMEESPGCSLFVEAAYAKYGALRMLKFWKEEHDLRLLRAIAQHGYGRWVDILEDPQYDLQTAIRQELMLPQNTTHFGISNGSNVDEEQATLREAEAYAWKKIIEFVKKRISLLEGALNTEFHLDDQEAVAPVQQVAYESHVMEIDNEPKIIYEQQQERPVAATYVTAYPIPIAPEEVSSATLDDDPKRLEIVQLYNQMCSVLAENRVDAFQTYVGNKSAGVRLRKCIRQVDLLSSQIRRGLGAKTAASQQPGSSSEDKDRPSSNGNGNHTGDTDMNTSDTETSKRNDQHVVQQEQMQTEAQEQQPKSGTPVVILD